MTTSAESVEAATRALVDTLSTTYPDYKALIIELMHALHQAAEGKGKHRHAKGKAFQNQIIMTAGRVFGLGFHFGQVTKKMDECSELHTTDEVLKEIHGAIVYLGAAAILVRERQIHK